MASHNCIQILLIVALSATLTLSKPSFTELTPRIFGGEAAEPSQFRFMASLRALDKKRNKYNGVCGAAIIADYYVLTAAHCTRYNGLFPYEYRIYTGSYGRYDGYRSKIYKFFVHPNYNKATRQNDIMLVQTLKPIIFSYSIKPIALNRDFIDADLPVTTMGWGRTNVRIN